MINAVCGLILFLNAKFFTDVKLLFIGFNLVQDLFGNEEILLETIDEIRRNPYRTEKLYSIYAGDSFSRDPESIRNGLHIFYSKILPNKFINAT